MTSEAIEQDSPSPGGANPARGLLSKPRGNGDWLARIDSHHRVNNALYLHRELPIWILRWDGRKGLTWLALNEVGRIQPFDFEARFDKGARREAHYWESLERAGRDSTFVVGELMGFNDFFYALRADRKGRTFLHGGRFFTEELDWDGIAWRWRALTGHLPTSANPDFMRFLRRALRVPVLEAPALEVLERLLVLLSELVTSDQVDVELHEHIEKLKRELLDRAWPNDDWVDTAISFEQPSLAPGPHEGTLQDFCAGELGVSRLPTTSMTLMPVYPKNQTPDAAQVLLKNAQIQRACLRFIRQMPETGANRLHDYGVSILTSPAPGKSAARANLELRERAQKLQAFVQATFGVSTVVGIGRTLPPGAPLYRSHHDATLAMYSCVQLEKDLLFWDEKSMANEGMRYSRLDRAAAELSDAFDRVAADEIKQAREQYVRLVLVWATERVEVVRSQFLSVLFSLIKNIQKRHLLRNEVTQHLAEDLSQNIEQAPSVYRAIETFAEAVERLCVFASRALEGPRSMRLDTTLQYLKRNFAEPLRLTSVARRAGFSVPAFSRIFKQATGTSFLAYLRSIRVEHAKLLLRTTTLSAEQIAKACGFQSQHHLIRSFKKVSQSTPGTYRKDAQARATRPSTG